MPYSLIEHVPTMKDPLRKGAYLGIIRESAIADLLTWDNSTSLQVSGVRYDEVNEPEFVALNQPIPENTVRGKNLTFGVYELARHFDIPAPLERDNGAIEKPSTRQAELAIIGAAYKFNTQFVRGDQANDPNGFEGIEKLVTGLAPSQQIGSTELDLTGNPSSAVIQATIDRIDEAIDAINGHRPTFALVSRQAGQRLRSAFRRERQTGDVFDWINTGMPFKDIRQSLQSKSTDPMFVYNKVPFYDAGPMADMTTPIIGNNYAEAGSSGATRIYFVRTGPNDLQGLQFSPLKIENIGRSFEVNGNRHRLLWDVGLALWQSNSLSVVRGVKVV